MLALGAAAGAAYAMIPALCKVRFGASEILTSLMLVYVAELFLDYLVRGPWRDALTGRTFAAGEQLRLAELFHALPAALLVSTPRT